MATFPAQQLKRRRRYLGFLHDLLPHRLAYEALRLLEGILNFVRQRLYHLDELGEPAPLIRQPLRYRRTTRLGYARVFRGLGLWFEYMYMYIYIHTHINTRYTYIFVKIDR